MIDWKRAYEENRSQILIRYGPGMVWSVLVFLLFSIVWFCLGITFGFFTIYPWYVTPISFVICSALGAKGFYYYWKKPYCISGKAIRLDPANFSTEDLSARNQNPDTVLIETDSINRFGLNGILKEKKSHTQIEIPFCQDRLLNLDLNEPLQCFVSADWYLFATSDDFQHQNFQYYSLENIQ